MEVEKSLLMEQGFLILREVIPPSSLEHMRENYDVVVERQKEIWAEQRGPDDPPGGRWEMAPQPRVGAVDDRIDESTADAVEIWFHENTLGVARQLLCHPEPLVVGMHLMCSPARDHGPAAWHRDIHPIDMAPLANLQADLLENGPRYLQWNIPLYDDNVLWVIPGSHRRLNTEAENKILMDDNTKPLPGGIPVELKAGDGVVYINFLFHQGSDYSTKLRRTIHGGHCIFAASRDLGFTKFLSPTARETIERGAHRISELEDVTEIALRSIMAKDPGAYRDALETLQPGAGEEGKMVLTIYLSKIALFIHYLKNQDGNDLAEPLRQRAVRPHAITLHWGPQFADRFTDEEADVLQQRFAALDAKLQAEKEHFVPGFQSQPMRYFFNEMSENFDLDDFIASWDD